MTASHFTPRLALPYPDETDPADVPLDIANLANKLDTITARTPGAAATAAPVLDVGLPGQVRAGRQLAVADFTALGLSAPAGLWNLSSVSDASGNGRNLVNKGAVPFGVGINGAASTAAVFAGSTGQALYIADTGAADPFRITTGSWGCWLRTARGADQYVLAKSDTAGTAASFWLSVAASDVAHVETYTATGASLGLLGVSSVANDRWHWVVATSDGTTLRLYVDAVLEGSTSCDLLFSASGPLNIGGYGANASTATSLPHYGRVDEAFVTADVLSEDQIRNLYCASIPHGFSVTPTVVNLAVRRRRKGGTLAVADFPTQPLRLHNFTGGSLADQGSNGVAQANTGTGPTVVAGADGALNNALSVAPDAKGHLASVNTGLPAGTAARSYGCWFKGAAQSVGIIGWGTTGSADVRLTIAANGIIYANNGADAIQGPFTAGQWLFALAVEDNAAGDGVRRKLYVDGRLVAGSTVLNPITLSGTQYFRIGANPDGSSPFAGQIDGAFVCGYALTGDQVRTLYAKGSQALAPSPKNAGDHVEAMDATNVYATFDTLDSQHQIDLQVTG